MSKNDDDNKSNKSILRKESDAKKPNKFRFDEENIRETYHPPGKTYGHMKIDEPNTPYERSDSNLEEQTSVNPADLFNRLQQSSEPEEIKHRKQFEDHRKMHYNEFQQVQEYLKNHAADEDDDEDDEDGSNCNASHKSGSEEEEEDEHLRIARMNAERNKH
ncbi:hypothetical protein Ciccas_006936, partial [Cichlidogyrus casuarinus]